MQLSFFSNDKNYDKINKNLKSILIRSNIFHILARTFFYIYIYIFCSTRSAYHYTSPLPFPPDITRNLFNEFFSFIGGWFLSFHLLFFALFNVPLGFPVIHCINFRLKRNHRLSGRYYTSVSLGDASKKRTNIPVGLAGAGRISRFHDFTLWNFSLCMCVCVKRPMNSTSWFPRIILHGSAVKCQLIIERGVSNVRSCRRETIFDRLSRLNLQRDER